MNDTSLAALEIMGIGMVSIILVMAIFYGVIVLIDRLFPIENSQRASDS